MCSSVSTFALPNPISRSKLPACLHLFIMTFERSDPPVILPNHLGEDSQVFSAGLSVH